MADPDRATSWRGLHRGRLTAAAAASVALHLLLARGLALTPLELDGRQPAAEASPTAPRKPAREFVIRVPKSPAPPPAHERPLAVAAARPASPPPATSNAQAPAATRASRWRPREVSLLERLTAPAARGASQRSEDAPESLPAAMPAARVAAAVAPADGTAAALAAPPAETAGAASQPGGVVARRGGATALAAARRDGPPATVAVTDAPGGASDAARRSPPGRDDAASPSGSGRFPSRAPVAEGPPADPEPRVPAAGPNPAVAPAPTAAAGPRAVGRAAGAGPRGPAIRAAGDRAGEELSSPPIAGAAEGGRQRDDGGPAIDVRRPPERVAAVALPPETRVRDVAAAFARRGRDARPDRRATRADAVVDRGLEFLARAQQADGRWSLGQFAGSGPADVPELASDTAATGLALLAFLGAGHDHFAGPRRDTVRRGLEFLLAAQKPDGDLYLPADDLSNSCAWLYSHGIASIALCEAVGMTGDPLVRPAAARACGFIAAAQHPERGGWRYAPRMDADLSVSGWMLVALRSGALAGVDTDPRALAGVRTLLDAATSATDPARCAYHPQKPDQRSSELSGLCMTAVGALMRLHTGARPDDPRVLAAARVLAARRPAYDAQGRDSYLWYYASQVLVHTGGSDWETWYADLVETLAAAQETARGRAGSWDPLGPRPDRWGRWGGRIYVTALHLLALEVPERRLPTYTAGE